jgi:hypothetical protein
VKKQSILVDMVLDCICQTHGVLSVVGYVNFSANLPRLSVNKVTIGRVTSNVDL